MTTGFTDIRITHPAMDLEIDTSSKHRTVDSLIHALEGIAAGILPGSIGVTQNGGTGVAASGAVTFSGPPAAADTVTINGTALAAQLSYARAVVTFSALQADDTVTVGATIFTAKVSPTTGIQFALGASDTEAAANLVAKINAHPTAAALVKAYSAAGVVTVRNLVAGTAGNAGGASQVAIASSNGTRAAVTGDSGGKLNGASAPANNKFDVGNTAAEAGAAFMAAVNASSTALVSGEVVATHDGAGVVTLTSVIENVEGNAVTLVKSGSNIAVSGSGRLTGGVAPGAGALTF